ncbi:sporulation-control protein [Streptosporangium becharense]|uniref:Sporulation-control protein n=1 Tax=Streptosporangium becharense TaxID=1816182 RepID=A0A7W9IN98_9ACTN|nr:sporulation protein [Streptosporangium becharense]MBB2910406.1 sporulation-control protein [Streptosporangium becharense]MBB5823149.1 sporulation-control protein [Streptosporangium becharense]
MVFKRLLGAFGVGAPSVDTVLATPHVRPGEPLSGEVRLKGGDFDADIEHIALGLVTQVEAEYGEGEGVGLIEFHRTEVSGSFVLRAGEERVVPFQFPVPWEAPVTEVMGQSLHGMAMGVRTELAIAKAVDKGDMDPVQIVPLPAQQAVLEAFARLGFHFKSADLEMGRIHGVDQRLPFYQEIEFYPPPQYSGQINEVELTFVTGPSGMDVVLEADKRSGRYSSGEDAFGRWQTSHHDAVRRDWAAEINGWLDSLSRYTTGAFHDPYASHGAGHHDPYAHGGSHYGGHHGSGPGMGAVAAVGAAGVAGGFIAAEAIDEIGDFFEGDGEEE